MQILPMRRRLMFQQMFYNLLRHHRRLHLHRQHRQLQSQENRLEEVLEFYLDDHPLGMQG
jgi:hypothetical protein